jgi:ribosomal RNA assembly protein
MKKLFFDKGGLSRILKLRKKIEQELNIKIKVEKKTIIIESKKEDSYLEYISSKIIEAASLGFEIDVAFQLKDVNFSFIKIDIKDIVRESRVNEAISRVIGKQGKTKKLISELGGCDIIVHEHIVGVIASSNTIETAEQALTSLIRGSKPSKIYGFLERNRIRMKKLAQEDVEEIIKEEQEEQKKEK